ncbi:hypothetical protein Taro_025430 [Colocasia esculenta]|uniref:Phylloplanin n=1 Tax=Colocasia esculenta TaxID=4460 RepID=A0A843V8V7_COLES|nr:hypothetical protein [Colocasia esculenta]
MGSCTPAGSQRGPPSRPPPLVTLIYTLGTCRPTHKHRHTLSPATEEAMATNFFSRRFAAAFLLAGLLAAAAPMAYAQLGALGGLLGVVRVGGVVMCSANATAATAGTPVFPNALVQLRCGGAVVSSATTNSNGAFSILLDPITTILSSLLSNCNLVVITPLSTCNAALPSTGLLQSALTLVGTALQGLLTVLSISPTGFTLVQ